MAEAKKVNHMTPATDREAFKTSREVAIKLTEDLIKVYAEIDAINKYCGDCKKITREAIEAQAKRKDNGYLSAHYDECFAKARKKLGAEDKGGNEKPQIEGFEDF